MSALANYTPTAITVVKSFAYSFRSAATADLVVWGVNTLNAGGSAASLLDFLFDYPVPQSPFAAYKLGFTDAAFCTALVDNFCAGISISGATRAAWVALLVPLVGTYPSRGAFVAAISNQVDTYVGTDSDLNALKAGLATRAEVAATFAQSAAGAVYDGHGFAQLTAPLQPAPVLGYVLSASAAAVNEGANVTFTLQTTGVPAGTVIGYALQGTGIDAADVIGGLMQGGLTVNAAGQAVLIVSLVNDITTEGVETLRMVLANGLAQAAVVVNDTSLTPPQPPTYALTANLTSQSEGAAINYTLATTNLPAGSTVSYALSGTGITPSDIVGGSLTGAFTINAQGVGTITVRLAADATTEGPEQLRLRLGSDGTQVDVTIVDSSLSPSPPESADTVVIADVMNNSRAHAPGSAAEGEMPLNSFLTYDLLNQSGTIALRVTVAGLKSTNPVAGAPLDTGNRSADRGNLPQLSNQDLFTFDLGGLIDRVDYSAESGKIVALVSAEAPASTLYVLVNDNGVDNQFSGATDRMDRLKNVEEVVASSGGGVIDLSASSQDLQLTFSRNFDATTGIDAAKDRATHRIELADLDTGQPYPVSFLEFRDAATSGSITQPTAAWTQVQGSDHDETLIFGSAQSIDPRLNELRGGTNAVRFNELTRSVLVDIAIVPWAGSVNPADDSNPSGQLTATTTFTNGDGSTPLSGNHNVTRSHTPDNNVAAGLLKISGSQDAEDAISFTGTPLPKHIVLGTSINGGDGASARLVAGPVAAALEISGFEILRDNGNTDDLYDIENIFKATQGSPRLTDGAGTDHDAVRLANEALGSSAVGGSLGVVSLVALNAPSPGFGFDFDVLDLSSISSRVQAVGTAGVDDELVVGALGNVGTVTAVESVVLTRTSIDKGTALTLDLDAGQVKAGSTTLFAYSGSVLSAGGLVFNTAGQGGYVAPVPSGLNITVVDTTAGPGATVWGGSAADLLIGGSGNDRLRGGGGNDTLDGGVPGGAGSFVETWAFVVTGTPDAVANNNNRITIAMTIDGAALTLTEAAVVDTAYNDGNGAVVDGSSAATIGAAMAGLINANLASINAGPGIGTVSSATFDAVSGTLLLSFLAGINANDLVTFVLQQGAGPDSGNFALSAGVNTNGGNGGVDTFVFEANAALNGRDTLLNFTPASDKLDVSAFAGAAIAAASPAINAATGGNLAGVATTVELIFNKSQGNLSTTDFAASSAAGKLVLADGTRCLVAVTADPTGARGDLVNTAVSLYYVENGAAAGLTDLAVSLVGVLTGPVELTLSDIFAALT